MKRIRVKENPFAIKGLEFDTNGVVRTVRCMHCGHRIRATFFKKEPRPDDIGYCPACGSESGDFEWAD